MERQTKNIITRESVERELRFYNNADIRSTLVLTLALSIFFIPFTILLVYAVLALTENVFLKIVLGTVAGVLMSAPIWINICFLFSFLHERKLIVGGEFEIVIRPVSYKSKEIAHRHTEELLVFSGFERTTVGHTEYQLASPGDDFCLVHYRNKKTIKLLYSLKLYEYKEN